MNPRLVPIAVALGCALLIVYVATFSWFAYEALFGTQTAALGTQAPANSMQAGPLAAQASEAVAYVWTTVSLLVGGVVAVAFGQTPPRDGAASPVEKLMVAYAWAFIGVGLAAVAVWIFASGRTPYRSRRHAE